MKTEEALDILKRKEEGDPRYAHSPAPVHSESPEQTGHTPGPWRVGDAGITIFGPPSDQPSPITIAHVAQSTRSTRDERRANARLIAAAPALLEACKGMFEVIEARVRNAEISGWQQKLQRGRDAIARAEGRNQ